MHNAPSVTYPVGRSFFLAGLWFALALLSASLWTGWIVSSGSLSAAHLFMLLLWLAAIAVAGGCWRRPARGELQWDGQAWTWRSGTATWAGQVAVQLDWQSGLLLAFVCEAGRTQWLWLARSTDARRWLALRRALYVTPSREAKSTVAGELVP